MMTRVAQIRQTGVAQPSTQVRRKKRAVREAGDLREACSAALDDPDDVFGPQQWFAAAGDDESRRSSLSGKGEVRIEVDRSPVDRVAIESR